MYERLRGSAATLLLAISPVFATSAFVSSSSPAHAQAEVTVFAPFRGIAAPIARAGSAVSVIDRDQIEQAGQVSVQEILRGAPGVTSTNSGGFGANTDVRIRGAEAQHTMVLINGIPVTDPTSTRNAFDFTMLPASIIERIEVLRGPQSALYGSDAIGGVINIITRQAPNGLSATALVEGGSFDTHRQALSAGYGAANGSIFVHGGHVSTNGFSRRDGNAEDDGARQWTGGFRATARLSETVEVDAAFDATDLESEYDRRSTDPAGGAERLSLNGHARISHSGFDGRWRQTLTAFGSSTDRQFIEPASVEDYEGSRIGIDYTGEVQLGSYGTFLYGATVEEQTADYVDNGVLQFSGDEVYWGAFALHQFSVGPNLHLSAALRYDDFAAAGDFVTFRGTAVYEIPSTETRFHASVGTGAKAPSLRQRAATPNLRPEESIGFDAGVTQTLFDGRLTLDVTGFYQEIDDLIVYTGGFFGFASEAWDNVDEAEIFGVEITADARVVPGHLDARAHYTYTDARDAVSDDRLQRRPEHEAELTLIYTGIDKLRLSATAYWTGGEWFSRSRERTPLDSYVRVDAAASYQVHEHLEIYGRVENLFDAEYEEISGFNTPGISAYAGIRATY
ncbi:MAG: TonB-dependent receptor [Pseudomonadota bacterium]